MMAAPGEAETIAYHNARIAAIETQKIAALAKADFQTHRELSIAAGDAQMAKTYQSGGEGRKGKG